MTRLSQPPRPILILGVPRSGTTWLEQVLGVAPGVRVVHEPDNETNMPWPLLAKAGLGRFPLLMPGDPAPAFESLWRDAFSGVPSPPRVQRARRRQQRRPGFDWAEAACDPARRLDLRARALALLARPSQSRRPRMRSSRTGQAPTRPLVKSVHGTLCADWIAERFRPAILVVQRDPVETVASWGAMAARTDARSARLEYAGRPARILSKRALDHMTERYGPPPASRNQALIWLAGGLMCELRAFGQRCADATVLDFDAACAQPGLVLPRAAARLGLPWDRAAEARLAAINRPGEGWQVTRRTMQVPGAWRRRLSPSELAELERGLAPFERLRDA